MEPTEGFEPPTLSLQVRRSGQLSYVGFKILNITHLFRRVKTVLNEILLLFFSHPNILTLCFPVITL